MSFEHPRHTGVRSALLFAAALVLPIASLAACGSDSNATGGGAASADSSTTASTTSTGSASGGGGASSCPTGSHAAGATCEATLAGWSNGPSLTEPRDHHVTFIATTSQGSFLYVAAGTNALGTALASVDQAPIMADGTLGPFAETTTLPEGLIGPGMAQVGNGVVIGGGLSQSGTTIGDTFVGAISDAGVITFTPGSVMNTGRYHVSYSADRGYVYAIGGLIQSGFSQSISSDVERATFDGTTLGPWTALTSLDQPITHQAAVVYEHAIYLAGGIHTDATITDVVRAAIDDQGDLGAFTKVGDLPAPLGTAAAFVFLDQLYVLGGATGLQSDEVATVYRADLNTDGTVGVFETLAPEPMARAHDHQTPLLNGIIYSAGGISMNAYEDQVFLGQLQ